MHKPIILGMVLALTSTAHATCPPIPASKREQAIQEMREDKLVNGIQIVQSGCDIGIRIDAPLVNRSYGKWLGESAVRLLKDDNGFDIGPGRFFYAVFVMGHSGRVLMRGHKLGHRTDVAWY